MHWTKGLPLAAGLMLGACGGGGGGIASTPTPPPAPTNTTLTDLKVSQSFTTDGASNILALDLKTKTAISAKNAPGALAVRYDAASNSYTVTTPARAVTFTPADMVTSTIPGEARYLKTGDTARDYLTLVKIPYTGQTATQYVGLGYTQHNTTTAGTQDTEFSTFTYGLDTPASAVPRTGTAAFSIDVFGLATAPGYEPRQFQGRGSFSTDFAAGVFAARSYVTETELSSGGGTSGGGIELTSAGRLASNGTFAGNMLYGGFRGQVPGQLSGRFYGPDAQELGATFSGGTSSGAAVVGAFTGQRDTTAKPANLTLTNITSEQLFYTSGALLSTGKTDGRSDLSIFAYSTGGQLNRQNDETFTYGPGLSNLPYGQFTIADKVAGTDANFTAYRKTINGQEVTLELYRPGTGNTELALTYASLGRWSTTAREGIMNTTSKVYLAYGLETPAGLLGAKTGTGRYAGVVYGAGANRTTAATYDVKGTSRFEVDFSNQRYSGALAMTGTGTNGTPSIDFGSYDFTGKLGYAATLAPAAITGNGAAAGELNARFYGPDGEEIAGTFILTAPAGSVGAGTTIAGATAARRQ